MSSVIKVFWVSALTAGLLGTIGCGSTRISIDEAYEKLEPVKQLELPEQLADNLVVKVNNVADEYNSYKNHVDVLVNDKIINPNWNVSNIEENYTFSLKVKPGYYDIKAYYYAYVGWGEEKFEIKTLSPVRVSHDKQTVVEYDLVKKENGEPVDKTMVFNISNGSLLADDDRAVQQQMDAGPVAKSPNPDKVTLQINTVPENAKIILDDQVAGYAPLKLSIDPGNDYVLQISAEGFKTYTQRLDKASFKGHDKVLIIRELEPLNVK